jgi:hypothetical protein
MRSILGVVVLSLFFTATGQWVADAQAGTPNLWNFQGTLTDSTGTPLDGEFAMRFQLYNAPAGGTSLYIEFNSVDVVDGYY